MCSQRWQTAFERNGPEALHHRGAEDAENPEILCVLCASVVHSKEREGIA